MDMEVGTATSMGLSMIATASSVVLWVMQFLDKQPNLKAYWVSLNPFRGHVYPGDSATIDLAGEYSLTRSWVLALDLIYQHANSTRVSGTQPQAPGSGLLVPFESATGASESFAYAPAVEYSWSSTAGVIAGVRIIPAGRNINTTITPAIAINLVF